MQVGANYQGDSQCQFTVWAPLLTDVKLKLLTPQERLIPLQQNLQGYWSVLVSDCPPGTRYLYRLDDKERADPASFYQPDGVHKASEVIDHTAFSWTDTDWTPPPFPDWVIYELHVGAFTPDGSFHAIIPRLPRLKELGVNAIEIMPVAQFPGERNWGYDGTYPFAVQQSYGGPTGLKTLVNACHEAGIAVVLDVVYNHFGPEGNYTRDFGPYFTDRYQTPWGSAINFDGSYCDGVRNFMIENALYWLHHFHIDALRLDAVHAIYDLSAKHLLAELSERVQELMQTQGQGRYLIAESDLNDPRIIRPHHQGGYGMDAQWSDEFHHALHALLTGERSGYYEDFGSCHHLAKVLHQRYVYTGDYSPHRKRRFGADASDRPTHQFVVCNQNHDQVGNRMLGERLSQLVSFEALKLTAATMLLSPYTPMLFMGEEYGEEAPFLYFIDHGDPDLVEAVREGRKREFAAFHAQGSPPDAKSLDTVGRRAKAMASLCTEISAVNRAFNGEGD